MIEEEMKSSCSNSIKVRSYLVFSRALEEGVDIGWTRVHKHDEAPCSEDIKQAIVASVIDEVCEYFDFGESL